MHLRLGELDLLGRDQERPEAGELRDLGEHLRAQLLAALVVARDRSAAGATCLGRACG